MTMLNVDALSVSYGQVRAVNGISFSVKEGDLVSLIGANGAGKTTLPSRWEGCHWGVRPWRSECAAACTSCLRSAPCSTP